MCAAAAASKGCKGWLWGVLAVNWSEMKMALSQEGAHVSATAFALDASDLLCVRMKQNTRGGGGGGTGESLREEEEEEELKGKSREREEEEEDLEERTEKRDHPPCTRRPTWASRKMIEW